MTFLWMCDAPLPPAEHGGVVVTVGSQPLEVVAHADGQLAAYPIATSTARGPETTVVVHVPGADGTVHTTLLVWSEPTASFVGVMPVAPRMGPIEIDAIVAGAPLHATAPVFVVLAPTLPVVVGAVPGTVDVREHGRGRVEIVQPARPDVIVQAPRPGVFIEPPRPLVVIEPPRPPGVFIEAPRPGVVVMEPEHGHWDHGRHEGDHDDRVEEGGRGEWHEGGGGHGEGHGHGHGD